MKHTTDDLLLAAQIRLVAIDLQKIAFVEARKAADLEYKTFIAPDIVYPYTDEDMKAELEARVAQEQHLSNMESFENDWYASNPLQKFVKPALATLEEIAAIIKSQAAG